jgi:hypothetical protein
MIFICNNIMAEGMSLLKITKVYKWSRKNIMTIVVIVWLSIKRDLRKSFSNYPNHDVRSESRQIDKWQKDHPMYSPKQVPVCMSWNLEDCISTGKGSLVRHFQNLRCCHKAGGRMEGTPHSGWVWMHTLLLREEHANSFCKLVPYKVVRSCWPVDWRLTRS